MATFPKNLNAIKDRLLQLARTVLAGRNGRIVNVVFSVITLAAVVWLLYGQREVIAAENWSFDWRWALVTVLALAVDMIFCSMASRPLLRVGLRCSSNSNSLIKVGSDCKIAAAERPL